MTKEIDVEKLLKNLENMRKELDDMKLKEKILSKLRLAFAPNPLNDAFYTTSLETLKAYCDRNNIKY